MSSSSLKAVVLGGTGAIGRGIVSALACAPQYESVTLIVRKPFDLPPPSETSNYSKIEQKVMDFDKIPEHVDLFKGHDVGFYAIGVSQNAVPKEAYLKIELDNAIALATLMKEAGIPDVHWITGNGSSKNSWFLFGKTKAQVEEAISSLGFRRVSIYRPGGILTEDGSGGMGPTAQKVMRALDSGKWSVDSKLLGKVMVANSLKDVGDKAVEIWENRDITKTGKQL